MTSFDHHTLREGVVIFKDGNIRTNKGVFKDPRIMGDINYNESLQKQYKKLNKETEKQARMVYPQKENPELDLPNALAHTGGYKK